MMFRFLASLIKRTSYGLVAASVVALVVIGVTVEQQDQVLLRVLDEQAQLQGEVMRVKEDLVEARSTLAQTQDVLTRTRASLTATDRRTSDVELKLRAVETSARQLRTELEMTAGVSSVDTLRALVNDLERDVVSME